MSLDHRHTMSQKLDGRAMVKIIVLRQDPPLCKKTGGLFMYPLPHLKIWLLVCVALILTGVEIKKKIQTSLCHFSSNTIFMQIKYFDHVANQAGGILHNPPTPYKVGLR